MKTLEQIQSEKKVWQSSIDQANEAISILDEQEIEIYTQMSREKYEGKIIMRDNGAIKITQVIRAESNNTFPRVYIEGDHIIKLHDGSVILIKDKSWEIMINIGTQEYWEDALAELAKYNQSQK